MAVTFFDLEKDTHANFVAKYSSGDLQVRIDTNAAGHLFQTILRAEYGQGQAVRRTIAFGGFLGGLISIFFVGWWSLIGFSIGFIGMKTSRSHTNKSVIDAALKYPSYYEALVKAKILAYDG